MNTGSIQRLRLATRQPEWTCQERGKGLHCLLEITRLVEQHVDDVDAVLQGIVDLLPFAVQYPDIANPRIVLRGRTYSCQCFRESPWMIVAPVMVRNQPAGRIEIFYQPRGGRPKKETVFLPREQVLLQVVAAWIGKLLDRLWAERRLREEHQALEEANFAIRGVYSHIEEEKRAIEASVLENIRKVVLPVVDRLEREIPALQRQYTSLLRKQLEEIVSPLACRLTIHHAGLSPSEIQICELVRDGHSTKQIAQLRGVSVATIKKQREQIRRKLALQGTGKNLSTHLSSLAFSEESIPEAPHKIPPLPRAGAKGS
jgi:DNA-binding CsgD family transcriptional regulator